MVFHFVIICLYSILLGFSKATKHVLNSHWNQYDLTIFTQAQDKLFSLFNIGGKAPCLRIKYEGMSFCCSSPGPESGPQFQLLPAPHFPPTLPLPFLFTALGPCLSIPPISPPHPPPSTYPLLYCQQALSPLQSKTAPAQLLSSGAGSALLLWSQVGVPAPD